MYFLFNICNADVNVFLGSMLQHMCFDVGNQCVKMAGLPEEKEYKWWSSADHQYYDDHDHNDLHMGQIVTCILGKPIEEYK